MRRPPLRTSILALVALGAAAGLLGLVLRHPAWPPFALPARESEAQEHSIVVLPFADLSERHDQEYFSDGLTEELIQRIGRVANLRVVARTSAFYFKGRADSVEEIARRLGVSHVLRGSVRRDGDSLQIRAELVRASDGTTLWTQSFEHGRADVFHMQDEIAASVARRVDAMFEAPGSPDPAPEASVDAHDLVLQANHLLRKASRPNAQQAIELYQRALAIEPRSAKAWVGLASAYRAQARFGWVPVRVGFDLARDAARRALGIAPRLAAAHCALALVYRDFDWDWPAAILEFQQAIEAEPANATYAVHLSYILANLSGELTVHIADLRRAIRDDPLDLTSRDNLAGALFEAGRFEESIRESEEVLRIEPSYAGAHAPLALSRLYLGQGAQAIDAIRGEQDEGSRLAIEPIVFWKLGRRAESNEALRKLVARYGSSSAVDIAAVHAVRGEADAAIASLERGFLQRESGMQYLRTERLLESVRDDPRFRAILLRMKLLAP
jgi:TolB-like protein/tetratricopeptide (TPR) repeat protein